jgi:myosin-light-chain kinase
MGCGGSKEQSADPAQAGGAGGGGAAGGAGAAAGGAKPAAKGNTQGKLLDKYTLGKVLGQGAFGVVYSCTLKDGNGTFAVKMIDKVDSPLEDIDREVQQLRKLAHPTVVKLHDVYYEKVFVYMVLDLYKGGDMIEGMQTHWKLKGQIPIPTVQRVTKQMLEGIAWLHSKDVVHRDVKGDNYLMSSKDISNSENRIYLSDFGTVLDLKPGERLKSTCGTKVYWSPEFYAMSYGLKVDVWAVGVVVFGLLTGRFPFNGEKDVKTKALKLPKARAPPLGEELTFGLLEKDEKKRLEAGKAKDHEWLKNVPSVSPEEPTEKMDGPTNIENYGANGGQQDRRRELVERLENARVGAQLKPAQQLKDEFEVENKNLETIKKFVWKKQDVVMAEGLLDKDGVRPETQDDLKITVERNTPGIEAMLKEHIDVSTFGKGQAKTIDELIHECQVGASQLMLDATAYKRVVRVVEIVLLRIRANSKFLVQVSETYKDGRERTDVHQIPGTKKLPHENAMQTAKRVLETRLQMRAEKGCHVILQPSSLESFEEEEVSPHFPGLTTVYRKEIIEGIATGTSSQISQKFQTNDQGTAFGWDWFDEKECEKKQVKLRFPKEQHDISALVQAPVGFDQDKLEEFLSRSGVNKDDFGSKEGSRTLKDFADELTRGEAALTTRADGKVVRVVDVVVLKMQRKNGEILVESEETARGANKKTNRLPAVKRRADENQFYSARRALMNYVKVDPNSVVLDEKNVGIVEEEKDSASYPGITSVYRKRIITATMAST